MQKHFFYTIIVISTLISSLFGSNLTYAAQSPARQSGLLRNQNPLATAAGISQPQAACAASTSTVNGVNIYTFATVGNCTWVVPSTAYQIDMLVVAGGGGGGYNRGGGGGGGQVIYTTQGVTPGSALTIAVGGGGGYAYSLTTNGVAGGASSVAIPSGTTTTATGGNGGKTFYPFPPFFTYYPDGGTAIAAIGVDALKTNLNNLGGGQGGNGNIASGSTVGGAGGAGYSSTITGSAVTFGRGGGGGSYVNVGTMAAYYGDGAAGGFYNSGGWTGTQGVVIIRESGKAPLSCPETTSIAATIFAVCATPMKNVTNKQSWLDQSGASLHFTAYEGASAAASTNGPQLASLNSGAYVFDGVNDYFSRNLVTNSKSNVSLQATFSTTDASKLGQPIAYNGSDAYGNGYGLAVNSSSVSNKKLWVLYGGVLWYDTGFTINSNAWYHAVLVISGTNLKVYVDQTLIYNVTTASVPNTPSLKTEIGRNDYPSPWQRYFNGSISSVTFYNAALTQAQVTALYNGVATNPTATRTSTQTASNTPTNTRTATRSNTPTQTATNTRSNTPT